MAVENHNSIFFSADDIHMLMTRFGFPPITACPDPANWVPGGIFKQPVTPGQWELLFAGVEKLAPYTTEAHLKVTDVNDDGMLHGWGAQLEILLRAFHQAGYTGAIAFESVADDDILAHLPKIREIVDATIARITAK